MGQGTAGADPQTGHRDIPMSCSATRAQRKVEETGTFMVMVSVLPSNHHMC